MLCMVQPAALKTIQELKSPLGVEEIESNYQEGASGLQCYSNSFEIKNLENSGGCRTASTVKKWILGRRGWADPTKCLRQRTWLAVSKAMKSLLKLPRQILASVLSSSCDWSSKDAACIAKRVSVGKRVGHLVAAREEAQRLSTGVPAYKSDEQGPESPE